MAVQSAAFAWREKDSEAERFSRERRRSWARLLRKIYEVDLLTCPQCDAQMRIIAFIKDGTTH